MAERARPLGLLDAVTDADKFRFYNSADLVEVHKQEESGEVVEVAPYLEQALAWLLSGPGPAFLPGGDRQRRILGLCGGWRKTLRRGWSSSFDPWRKADVAVLMLDHVPKRTKDRPPGPIGSQHKRARVDGAALRAFGQALDQGRGRGRHA